LQYAGIRREGMVDDSLSVVRRVVDGGRCYFIVNRGRRKWEGWMSPADVFSDAMVFDPMSGQRGRARVRKGVYLQLLPGESVIVRTFSSRVQGVEPYPYYRAAGGAVELKGEWNVSFVEGGPVLPAPLRVRELGSWTRWEGEEVKRFSGTAKYVLSFDRPGGAARAVVSGPTGKRAWMLDLGKVDLTARVFLNGREVGVLIGPYYRVVVPDSLLAARNQLEVYVSNGMANRIEDMDRRGVRWKKFYNYNFPAHVRENRGADGLFSAAGWKPLDAGMTGPVTLTVMDTIY